MKFPFKSALIACLVFLSASATVSAQRMDRQATPEQRAERQTEHLAQQLDLSEEQKAQVTAINLDYAQKMQDARAEAEGDRDAMRTIMEGLREEQNAEMAEVLTEEQYAEFLELQSNMQNRPRRSRRGKGQ